MPERRSLLTAWRELDLGMLWSGLVMIGFVLGSILIAIPVLDFILQEPSYRPPVLVLGIALYAIALLALTMPPGRTEVGLYSYHEAVGGTSSSALSFAESGSLEGMVSSLVDLRRTFFNRVLVRRRLTEERLRETLASQRSLDTIVGDDLLEELLRGNVRHLAVRMGEDGEFLRRFQELLERAEAWT